MPPKSPAAPRKPAPAPRKAPARGKPATPAKARRAPAPDPPAPAGPLPSHIRDLVPDPARSEGGTQVRRHTPRGVDVIEQAIKHVGFARGIVIDENNRILAGNASTDAAGAAGLTKVRTIEADGNEIIAIMRRGLTEDQKLELAIADNRAGELSGWENAELAAALAELEPATRYTMGFSDDEVRRIADLADEAATLAVAEDDDHGAIETTAEEDDAADASNFVPFSVLVSPADREAIYRAVGLLKARDGETTTGDALVKIVKEWTP